MTGRRRDAERREAEEREQLVKATAEVAACTRAQELLQELASQVQQKAHAQIGRVVSKCLSAVFDDPYELRIKFERKRGTTEAVFCYYKNGYELDPESTSGGVLDVATLALREASLALALPAARKTLILDEPFKAVDKVNLPRVAQLIATLVKEMNTQIILVTHNPNLEVGKVIRL